MGLVKSREETSGERRERVKKAEKREEKLKNERHQILLEAVNAIRDNGNCLKLKAPIRLALYGDMENGDGKVEKVIDYDDKKKEKQIPAVVAVMHDVQARLGAQALNSVINTKRFPEG
jgi:hypothetical protein